LFSSLDAQPAPLPVLVSLARCLAQRGEKVVLVDLSEPKQRRPRYPLQELIPHQPNGEAETSGNGHTPGVSEFLASQDCPLQGLVVASSIEGVDCLPAGDQPLPSEGLGSRKMRCLFDHLRESHTRILVNGPPLTQTVDVQMLADLCDYLVVFGSGQDAASNDAADALRELLDLGTPVLGIVG
jgi:Mrp family chromosome partitioning ATPase